MSEVVSFDRKKQEKKEKKKKKKKDTLSILKRIISFIHIYHSENDRHNVRK